MEDIRTSINLFPQKYTAWFRIAFPQLEALLTDQLADA
jgi:hypothetical protein